jgi:hypothetical protein
MNRNSGSAAPVPRRLPALRHDQNRAESRLGIAQPLYGKMVLQADRASRSPTRQTSDTGNDSSNFSEVNLWFEMSNGRAELDPSFADGETHWHIAH